MSGKKETHAVDGLAALAEIQVVELIEVHVDRADDSVLAAHIEPGVGKDAPGYRLWVAATLRRGRRTTTGAVPVPLPAGDPGELNASSVMGRALRQLVGPKAASSPSFDRHVEREWRDRLRPIISSMLGVHIYLCVELGAECFSEEEIQQAWRSGHAGIRKMIED